MSRFSDYSTKFNIPSDGIACSGLFSRSGVRGNWSSRCLKRMYKLFGHVCARHRARHDMGLDLNVLPNLESAKGNTANFHIWVIVSSFSSNPLQIRFQHPRRVPGSDFPHFCPPRLLALSRACSESSCCFLTIKGLQTPSHYYNP